MLWTCTSDSQGEWHCEGNDSAQPTASTPPSSNETDAAAAPAPAVEQGAQPAEEISSQPQTPAQPAEVTETAASPATQSAVEATAASGATAAAATAATETKTEATQAQVENTPVEHPSTQERDFTPTAKSSSAPAATTETAAVTTAQAASETEPALAAKPSYEELTAYPALYPQGYAAPPSKVSTIGSSNAPGKGNQWLCEPAAGGTWDCRQITGRSTQQYVSQIPASASAYPYAFLDWYEFPDGKSNALTHCPGRYIEPETPPATPDPTTGEYSTFAQADRSQTRDNNVTNLTGNILVQKGDTRLRSERATIIHDRELADFEGHVLYRQPGRLILSQNARFDQQQGTTEFQQVQFVFHDSHVRGDAEKVVGYDNNDIYITAGRYTRCEPGNESWMLSGSEIVLYQNEGYGTATHATLRVGGVPVLYMPYFHFPIDDRRKSGFLFPSMGYTSTDGLEIQAPYYFNIAPNIDDTLTPRYISKRGLMLENEFRYMNALSVNELNLAYLPNDDIYGEERWLLGFDHRGRPTSNTATYIDYTAVSDNDYFDDLDTTLNLEKETHLDKLARATYYGNGWQASAKVHGYQTITTANKPYQELPELRLTGNEFFQDSQYRFNYVTEYTQFDRDNDAFTGIQAATGQRLHLQGALSSEYRWPWAYVRPKATVMHTSYNLQDQPNTVSDNLSRTLPVFSIDSGMYFDRPMSFNDKNYTHTLEPRLFYLYVPYEDQSDFPYFDSSELTFSYNQLFRENRFSGYDRIGDANQITLGVTSRLLQDNGAELGHVSVGQIFYQDDRQVRLTESRPVLTDSRSNFVAEGLWQVSQHMRLTADGEWQNDNFNNVKRNMKLSYRSDVDHQFNAGYRFTKDDIEQLELSMIWPLNNNWGLLARWLQDLQDSETLDQIVGLEYENCCWRVRTLLRSWVDDNAEDNKNNGIFLQFTLKGLGSVGAQASGDAGPGASDFLEEITGFEERELYD